MAHHWEFPFDVLLLIMDVSPLCTDSRMSRTCHALRESGTRLILERGVSLSSGDIITSFALTEPEAGSDSGAVQTRAVRDGDHYVLNGAKRYITNANKADLFTVMARTDPNKPGGGGVSAFLVERNSPGLTVGKSEKKMGQQGAHVSEVFFDNVRVPAENRIGAEGEGLASSYLFCADLLALIRSFLRTI